MPALRPVWCPEGHSTAGCGGAGQSLVHGLVRVKQPLFCWGCRTTMGSAVWSSKDAGMLAVFGAVQDSYPVASPCLLQAMYRQYRNLAVPCCFCYGNLAAQYRRVAKPPWVVNLGSFYWCVSRLGCVRGKLPISRDCASRKGSYWNSRLLPPLQICSCYLWLGRAGEHLGYLISFATVCLG